MDAASFWRIVDGTLASADQIELLERELPGLPADEVLGFRRQLIAAHRRAYTRQMWLAAALLHSHRVANPSSATTGSPTSVAG